MEQELNPLPQDPNYPELPPELPPEPPPEENKPGKFPWWVLLLLIPLLGGLIFWGFWGVIRRSGPKPPRTNLPIPTIPGAGVPGPGGGLGGARLCGEWPKFGEAVVSRSSIPGGFPVDFPFPRLTKIVAGLTASGRSNVLYLCSDLSVRDVFSFYKNNQTAWDIQGELAPAGFFSNPYSADTQRLEGSKPSADPTFSGETIIILFYPAGNNKTLIDLFYNPGQSLGE